MSVPLDENGYYKRPSKCIYCYGLHCKLPKNNNSECRIAHYIDCPDYTPKTDK